MRQFIRCLLRSVLLAAVMGFTAGGAPAAESSYRQVVDGVAVYFGIVPAQLVLGHPPAHPESEMHGGAPVGDNHVMIALFDDKTGKRITRAEVTATITGPGNFKAEKKLESMIIVGAVTYGNYFYMTGPGPYRIEVRVRLPGVARERRVTFTWARS